MKLQNIVKSLDIAPSKMGYKQVFETQDGFQSFNNSYIGLSLVLT